MPERFSKNGLHSLNSECLLKLMEYTDDRIWCISPDYSLSYFNISFNDYLLRAYDELAFIGMNLRDVLSAEEFDFWKNYYDKSLENKKFTAEIRENTLGIERYSEVLFQPVRDGKNLLGVYVISKNITNQKENESKLVQAKEEAESANKAKSQFLAKMSHELRTPLNAVIGYSELLREDWDCFSKEEAESDLKKITDAGRHLLLLINDILDLSKVESGKMDLHIELFDLPSLLKEIQEVFFTTARENGNVIRLELEIEVGEVNSDIIKVKQCLYNLLSNACKFTSQGLITICASKEGENILLNVEDDGIGMSKEQLKKVFNPFTQADSTITKKFGGTGLGVSITQKFCELLGGNLRVHSELGVGTTFCMQIPAVSDLFKSHQKTEPSAQIKSPIKQLHQRVLIVSEDLHESEGIGRTLEKQQLNVSITLDVNEGIKKALKWLPDLILFIPSEKESSDMKILKKFKENPNLFHIPLIVLSSLEKKAEIIENGAEAFLNKSTDISEILKSIRDNLSVSKEFSVLIVTPEKAV